MTQRHASVQHVADLLEPNPNLPAHLRRISFMCASLRNELLDALQDGPELTAGLRKLLEAKDCFVRQALIDGQDPE